MTDPRERAKVEIDSAMCVDVLATWPRTAGRIHSKSSQSLKVDNKCKILDQPQTVVQGSPASSTTRSFTHLTSVSNQVSQFQVQGAVQFDLRNSCHGGGNICAVHYYIRDEDGACRSFSGDVRAIIDDVSEGEELQAILLGSGADAPVFPASMINAGIPLEGSRCVEIRLGTNTGKTLVLREKVAISSKVTS